MKTVRAALWPLLERAQALLLPELEAQLREALAAKGPVSAAFYLHQNRAIALKLANAGTQRQWQRELSQHSSGRQAFVIYTTAAWITRTIILAELFERSDLAITPIKWAAGAALSLVDDFESEDAWLWPFDSEPPWAEDDDDDG